MDRRQLIALVSADCDSQEAEVEKVLESMCKVMRDMLKDGREIKLRDFGTLKTVAKKGRNIYSFSEGRVTVSPDKIKVTFVPARSLTSIVNSKESNDEP